MAGNEVILLNRGCMGEPYVIENVCFVGSDESVDITIEQERIADCLLYTSPSPRDAHESRMPSSA